MSTRHTILREILLISVLMSQTKTCPKCGGVMKLKDEIQEGDPVSGVTPLDRTYTCDCGHMEVEV
jgi:hypothetical protein